jgi:sulfite exporter TauE/SafE
LDQLNEIAKVSIYLLPWGSFVIGLAGSAHCVGMCGGLVMSCSPTTSNNSSYQIGRLISYLILGTSAGFIGQYFNFSKANPYMSVIPGSIIGIMLIWLGGKHFYHRQSRLKLPKRISSFVYQIWGRVLPKQGEVVTKRMSFNIGAISILLPCGLLYGVVIALAAFNSPIMSAVCILTFWAGTLPVMAFAPSIVKRLLKPVFERVPVMTSVFLICLGLITIGNRVASAYTVHSCH